MNKELYISKGETSLDFIKILDDNEIDVFISEFADLISNPNNSSLFYPSRPNDKPSTYNAEEFLKIFNITNLPKGKNMHALKKNLRKIRLKLGNIEDDKYLDRIEQINLVGNIYISIGFEDKFNWKIFERLKIVKQTRKYVWFVSGVVDNDNILWDTNKNRIGIITWTKYNDITS
jgi:hypothetical protein